MQTVGRSEGAALFSAERAEPDALAAEIARAAGSPVITALLEAAEAAAVVLDRHRQVIAFNAAYLAAAGVERAEEVLGLRPGEALDCVHPQEDGAAGCGTTPACATCGAALAILAAQKGHAAERRCALRVSRDGAFVDRELRARAAPIDLEGRPLLLLVLRDVTAEARRAMLERSFMHDLSNLVFGLQAAAEELTPSPAEAGEDVRLLADQLAHEVRLQKLLTAEDGGGVARLARRAVELSDALALLRRAVERHPASRGRAVEWPRVPTGVAALADLAALHHVLSNMVLNALEAVPPGGRIRVEVLAEPAHVRVRAWNPGAIPAAVAPRIFQRYFSTKGEAGRGHGTWTMKLFGEELLGGQVTFESSAAAGTTFEVALPRAPDDRAEP